MNVLNVSSTTRAVVGAGWLQRQQLQAPKTKEAFRIPVKSGWPSRKVAALGPTMAPLIEILIEMARVQWRRHCFSD